MNPKIGAVDVGGGYRGVYAAEGKLLIITPDDTCGVHTLCRDSRKMKRLSGKGYADAEKITPFLFGCG